MYNLNNIIFSHGYMQTEATSMLVTDDEDEISWWQLWDVDDDFCRQAKDDDTNI